MVLTKLNIRSPVLLLDCIRSVSYTHLDVYKRQILPIPVLMIQLRTNGVYINHRFPIFRASFTRRWAVFLRYRAAVLSAVPPSRKASANMLPLRIALLIPSKELGLIKPAASPIR